MDFLPSMTFMAPKLCASQSFVMACSTFYIHLNIIGNFATVCVDIKYSLLGFESSFCRYVLYRWFEIRISFYCARPKHTV